MSYYPPPSNQQQGWPPQQPYSQHPQPQGPIITPPRRGGSGWLWFLGLGCLLPLLLCGGGGFGFLVYIGTYGPDTFAVPGGQIKPGLRKEIDSLQLVPVDEKILWYYSNGLFSGKEGMYILTDKRLVLYSENWTTPRVDLTFDQISDLDVVYNESFFEDSIITVYTVAGETHTFPMSSEQGNDRKFFTDLESRVEAAGN